MIEPDLQENDLEERLKTSQKRCEIALLLIKHNHPELLPTILEDLFFGAQTIIDLYCVKET